MPNYVVAYDADCGPCTRFKQVIDLLDRYHRIDFRSLREAEELGLLDTMSESLRFTSFHLISPKGDIWSGAEALPLLIDLFPLGGPISNIITRAPAGKRMIKFVYRGLSRLHDSGSCKVQHEKSK